MAEGSDRRLVMKRIALGVATGVLSMFLLAPCVKAQSWQDTQNDRATIANGHEQLRYDQKELRNDLRHGDYEAAAHEKAEMNQRRERIAQQQEDLRKDLHHRHHHRYARDWDDRY